VLLAQTKVCPEERPAAIERSGVVAVVDPASRPATASIPGVSSMRCPPIRFRRPGSGCPTVRCPVTWGRRPEGPASGRLLSTPCGVQPSAVCPVCPDASVSSHAQAVASGTRSRWPVTVPTGTGGGPGGCRAGDGSIDGRGGQGEVGGGPAGPPGWGGGPRRPRVPAKRPGRPGRGAGRPSGAAAGWGRGQAAARVGAPDAWLGFLGWVATTVGGRRRG
jgi:translation initiation factor IF-2